MKVREGIERIEKLYTSAILAFENGGEFDRNFFSEALASYFEDDRTGKVQTFYSKLDFIQADAGEGFFSGTRRKFNRVIKKLYRNSDDTQDDSAKNMVRALIELHQIAVEAHRKANIQ